MAPPEPEAVTFDFWNTLAAEGPGGLFGPRVRLWSDILVASGFDVDRGQLEQSHRAALEAYQAAWRSGTQFRSAEATRHVLDALGLSCDPPTIDHLERSFVDAGGLSDIALVEGAAEALHALQRAGISLAVICDIGLTPSASLVAWMEKWGVLSLFDVVVWSDELGMYKPDRRIFAQVLDRLGVTASQAWHVGDRRRTDVAGATAAGMTAVRFRGVYDDVEELPDAPIVVSSYSELLDRAGVS